MTQILKDCLYNVCKLGKEEFSCFLEFINNLDFVDDLSDIEYFSDIQNLTSNIFNYFLNVNDFDCEFIKNFVEKMKTILLKIKEPKINFGDIFSRFNSYEKDVDKVKFILPFLIYMNILSLDKNKKNYIIDLLIKDGNIIYLKSIYKKCYKIEQIADQTYKEFYEKEFNKFKENIIEEYVGDIIDFINCNFIFHFQNDLDGLCEVLENFWDPKRDVNNTKTLYSKFNTVHEIDFIKYIDFINDLNRTAKVSFDKLYYQLYISSNIKDIKEDKFKKRFNPTLT